MRWLAALLLAALLAWAWSNRFVQDDAYISFRYARNLCDGLGLVYNAGERVEGYTNFLWTLLLAAPMHFGWDPVVFAEIVGLICFALTLVATWRMATALSPKSGAGVVAMLLVGTNYSCSAYATGGLETSMQTALVATAAMLALACEQRGGWRSRDYAALSLLGALAVMTRLDSSVLLAAPAVFALLALTRAPRGRAALALFLPFGVLVGGWLVWKWHFYGALLPNTFYAKTGGVGGAVARGAWYVGLFLALYLLFVPLALAAWDAWRAWRRGWAATGWAPRMKPRLIVLGLACAAWTAYVVAVGGDFMEFRMMTPMMPMLAALLAGTLCVSAARLAILPLLIAASLFHAAYFATLPVKSGVSSIPELRLFIMGPHNWPLLGQRLHDVFGETGEVRLGVTAAGALPYSARLPVVDMLGLNDAFVARHGAFLGNRPGHHRIATIAYLRERGVNLVIGHPCVIARGEHPTRYATYDRWVTALFLYRQLPDPQNLPPTAGMLEIPLEDGDLLLAIYLTPSPAIEAKIRAEGWRLTPIVHADAPSGT